MLLVAAGWAVSSIGMTLLNKMAVSRAGAPLGILIFQMGITCVAALASRNVHLGKGSLTWTVMVPPLFVAMMLSSMLALQYVSVGTFVVVRNLGPLISLPIEATLHPSSVACDVMTAVSLLGIFLGVVVYEGVEAVVAAPSAMGIVLLVLNLSCTCAERMAQRHLLAVNVVDVSKSGLMLLNNLVGALLISCAVPFHPGEIDRTLTALASWPTGLVIVLSSLVGTSISYFGLQLQQLISATTFLVAGVGCKMTVILVGIICFGELSRVGAVLGALASLLGCVAYTQVQQQQKDQQQQQQQQQKALPWPRSLLITYAVLALSLPVSLADTSVVSSVTDSGTAAAAAAQPSAIPPAPQLAAANSGKHQLDTHSSSGHHANHGQPAIRHKQLAARAPSKSVTRLPGFVSNASSSAALERRDFLVKLSKEDPRSPLLSYAKSSTLFAPSIWYLYQPVHPCADSELVAGVWTCGVRRLQCPCVIYAVSHTDHSFADQIEALTPCEVLRFGPASGSQWSGTLSTAALSIGSALGGAEKLIPERQMLPDRKLNASGGRELANTAFAKTGYMLKTATLAELMRRHGHTQLDLLYLDAAGYEYDILDGFVGQPDSPSIGMLSVQFHLTSAQHVHTAFGRLRQSGYRDFRSTLAQSTRQQYSFFGPAVEKVTQAHDEQSILASQVAAHQHARADPAHSNVSPTWSCEETYVGLFGDGTKWICNLRDLGSPATLPAARSSAPCVVYSFGGSINTQFESAVRDLTPCEVHTFDLNCFETGCAWGSCYQGERLRCHKVRVGGSDDPTTSPPTKSLPTMMRELGHTYLDILKMDIEGAEHAVFRGFEKQKYNWHNVGQFLLETHESTKAKEEAVVESVIRQSEGKLTVFHTELNIYHTTSHEVAFVRAGSPGGMRERGHGSPETEPELAPTTAAATAASLSNSEKCKARCTTTPWATGCRPTASQLGLGRLSARYRRNHANAVVYPDQQRYVIVEVGGGFGNQVNMMVNLAAAAILTDRLLVTVPMSGSEAFGWKNSTTFDIQRYWHSSAFPTHAPPGLLAVLRGAEAAKRKIGYLTYETLDVSHLNDTAIMQRLADNDAPAVIRIKEHHQLVNHLQTHVQRYFLWADKANLPAARLVSALRRPLSRALIQVLLEPTVYLMRSLREYPMASATLGVHVRVGDAAMANQSATKDKTYWQTSKCGLGYHADSPSSFMPLFKCIEAISKRNHSKIFFASDSADVVAMAKRHFGEQMLPMPPGAPVHTFRATDHIDTSKKDVHLKQMLDFALLGSTTQRIITCGTFGDGADSWSMAEQTARLYAGGFEQCLTRG